uniref:Uncharacterized protein n=1 Tax=Anguilla anguilla TaxID=7936 RepID=A0A0E9W579_ANGAN
MVHSYGHTLYLYVIQLDIYSEAIRVKYLAKEYNDSVPPGNRTCHL